MRAFKAHNKAFAGMSFSMPSFRCELRLLQKSINENLCYGFENTVVVLEFTHKSSVNGSQLFIEDAHFSGSACQRLYMCLSDVKCKVYKQMLKTV